MSKESILKKAGFVIDHTYFGYTLHLSIQKRIPAQTIEMVPDSQFKDYVLAELRESQKKLWEHIIAIELALQHETASD